MGNNNIWNDPEWENLRRLTNKQPPLPKPKPAKHSHKHKKPTVAPPNAPGEAKKVEVKVNLTIPRFRMPPLPVITRKQAKIGITLGILLISLVGVITFKNTQKDASPTSTDTSSGNSQEPPFKTVLPDGKKESTTDNSVKYDPNKQVANYRDKIGSTTITVSQQQLPESFKANPDEEVKKVAEGFSANEVLQESNPKAYLGNDVKGAQTVIFHKNGLLVFILSDKPIEKSQWAEYITKLI